MKENYEENIWNARGESPWEVSIRKSAFGSQNAEEGQLQLGRLPGIGIDRKSEFGSQKAEEGTCN